MEYKSLHIAYSSAVADIIARAPPKVHPEFRPARADELDLLQALKLPESVELFYEEFAPDENLGVWGIERDVVLFPIKGINWYRNAQPGPVLSRLGFVAFGTTCSGDYYCFDLATGAGNEDPPIWLMSHERDYDSATRKEVLKHAQLVTKNLLDFLVGF